MNTNDMTTEQRLGALECKLAEMKRSYRTFTVVALAAGACVIGATVFGVHSLKARPTVIAELCANKFILVDPAGRGRAMLTVNTDKGPSLSLHDATGTVCAMLALDENKRPGLSLNDATGKVRAVLSVLAETEGGPTLALFDATGKPRARLNVLTDGLASLILHDANAETGALVSVMTNKSNLMLYDRTRTSTWSAGSTP